MRNLYLMFPETIGVIEPEVYGHFAEHIGGVIYDGVWVGKDSDVENVRGFRRFLLEKLKEIHPPVVRWPGGCFAETYDWRDGIGQERPVRPNWWSRWDGKYETNEVGTHEFMDFCEILGTQPYFAANITSTTPLHIRNWVDYCNSEQGTTAFAREREQNGHPEAFGIRYWGIGNENWGGGGNMDPKVYAHEYRKYSALLSNLPGEHIWIACGPNAEDYEWTRKFMEVMEDSEKHMNGFSLHYYCGTAGDPVAFNREEWYQQLHQAVKMDRIVNRHWSIIRGYGMENQARLVVDEWGCWHPDGSGPSHGGNLFEQQSTIRDAAVAAVTLNIFNNNCEKIMMANVAQLVNNLHSLFLAQGEHCIVTPTWHVFRMYQEHQAGTAIRTAVEQKQISFTDKEGKRETMKDLSVSASWKGDHVLITVVNLSIEEEVSLILNPVGKKLKRKAVISVLADEDCHAHNTFENPERVQTRTWTADLEQAFTVPKGGIAAIEARVDE